MPKERVSVKIECNLGLVSEEEGRNTRVNRVHSMSVVSEDYVEGRRNSESSVQPESSELKGRKQYPSKQIALYECSE